MRTELVVSALKMALKRGRKITGEIWLHSDRGVQFAAEMFREALRLAGIGQSMSRKGTELFGRTGTPGSKAASWDNAPCESWFGKLKSEWIYRHGVYATRNEAELAIVEYIEMIYNSDRVHQALDRAIALVAPTNAE